MYYQTLNDHLLSEDTLSKQKKLNTERVEKKRYLKFKQLTARQKMLLQHAASGSVGLALGAVAMFFMGFPHGFNEGTGLTPPNFNTDCTNNPHELAVSIPQTVPFSDAVNNSMSFGQAFSTARQDVGRGGFFEWRGQSYNTFYKAEWEALSAAQRKDFFTTIDPQHSSHNITNEEGIVAMLHDSAISQNIATDTQVEVIGNIADTEIEVIGNISDSISILANHLSDNFNSTDSDVFPINDDDFGFDDFI